VATYDAGYFLGGHSDQAAARRSQMKAATGQLYLDVLAALVPPHNPTLLEIGCGHGEVLLEARRRGFHVTGIEPSEHAAATANARLGTPLVQAGSLEAVDLCAESFDAVLAADVIEHVRNPQSFLNRLQILLRPGGTLLLITPSLDSWTRRLLRGRWLEYKIEHLYYFNPASIGVLLEKAGFSEIRIQPSHKVLTFDYIWRHFERFPVPLLSPVFGVMRRMMPDWIACRHVRLSSSGLMAIARKPAP
jgi:cyclopropane fatty-acyl-phospholipid synthase-like methyltransferase